MNAGDITPIITDWIHNIIDLYKWEILGFVFVCMIGYKIYIHIQEDKVITNEQI